MELAERLIRRQAEMAADRSTFDSHWQEIVDYMMPMRQGIITAGSPGEKKMSKIFDSTATHSLHLLAAGLNGMLTNPAMPWFILRLPDEDLMEQDEVKGWLQEVEKRIYLLLAQSNFGTEIHECYLDLAGFGTACMFVGETDRSMYFDNRHIAEITLSENSYGQVDTVFRKFSLTARQIVDQWPKEASRDVQDAARDKPDRQFELLHAVYPREKANPRKKDRKNFPIASIYLETKTVTVLSEAGFQEFPYLTPRWEVASGELFGRSPAMIALPFVKLLNEMRKTVLKAAQKQVDPPLLVSHDGFVNPIRTTPGGLNVIRADEVTGKLMPFPTAGGSLGITLEMIQDMQNNIRTIFFNDQLQIVADTKMTATEVMQRTEERMRSMGPLLGRMQSEFLKPLIDRIFGIMWRKGYLPPPPPELAGQEIDVEYVSPLAKAQKGSETTSISRLLEMAMPLMQVAPEVMDNIDADELVRYVADIQGIPEKIVRPQDEVDDMRAARASAAQAQAAMETAQGMAEAVPKLSGDIGPDSPLAMLAGMEMEEETV